MTTVLTDLVDECRQRGIALYLDGDELRYRGPRGAMTPALREEIAGRRADLVALLRQPAPPLARKPAEQFKPSYLPCACPSAICWRCCNRPCEVCGQPTGSAFIRRCVGCGQLPDTT